MTTWAGLTVYGVPVIVGRLICSTFVQLFIIYTIILCCPCYMPKYVPRLEGIMHDPEGRRALCLLTLGHISAYNGSCIMPSNLGTYFGI